MKYGNWLFIFAPMKLRELNIGDRFIAVSDRKRKVKYEKAGKCEFNRGHGTSTCKCLNENVQFFENKSCNLEVIKLPSNGQS